MIIQFDISYFEQLKFLLCVGLRRIVRRLLHSGGGGKWKAESGKQKA